MSNTLHDTLHLSPTLVSNMSLLAQLFAAVSWSQWGHQQPPQHLNNNKANNSKGGNGARRGGFDSWAETKWLQNMGFYPLGAMIVSKLELVTWQAMANAPVLLSSSPSLGASLSSTSFFAGSSSSVPSAVAAKLSKRGSRHKREQDAKPSKGWNNSLSKYFFPYVDYCWAIVGSMIPCRVANLYLSS